MIRVPGADSGQTDPELAFGVNKVYLFVMSTEWKELKKLLQFQLEVPHSTMISAPVNVLVTHISILN